jgi:hypothetical protein
MGAPQLEDPQTPLNMGAPQLEDPHPPSLWVVMSWVV